MRSSRTLLGETPLRKAVFGAATLSACILITATAGALETGPAPKRDVAAARAAAVSAPVEARGDHTASMTPPLDQRDRANAGRALAAAVMREGGGVRPPYGFTRFCASDQTYCAPPEQRRPGASVPVSDSMVRQLEAFNRSVNHRFEPREDLDVHGVTDHWTFPSVYADCEDYVLEKQARLLEAGWPKEALLIGVVVGRDAPYHAVLIVRTSKGELVLDNLTDEVRDWRETGYTWVIRQSTQHAERWVEVVD
ncbi:MAG: transglutaminase-like cysteine peptidase [Pseudomonadota bacterium]